MYFGVGLAMPVPLPQIELCDGRTISSKSGGFAKKGEPLVEGYSSAFEEVIVLFKANVKAERQWQPRSGRQ